MNTNRNFLYLQIFLCKDFSLSLFRLLLAFAGVLLCCGLVERLAFAGDSSRALRIATGKEIESLDPAFVDGSEASMVARSLFEGLVVIDPKTARAAAGIAESWKLSPDQKTFVFHLRKNATWSDGKPVTANDFYFAWKRVLEPSSGAFYANLFDIIEGAESYRKAELKDFSKVGIRVINAQNFEVKLREPASYAIDVFSNAVFLPLRSDKVGEKDLKSGQWLQPGVLVNNGPFILKEWKHKQKLTLSKNQAYYGAKNIALETVEIIPIDSFKTALQMYEAGQLDWLRRVPSHLVSTLKDRPDFHTGSMLNTVYLRFNINSQAFADKRLRKAISLAIDRKILAEKVAKEGQIPAERFTPPGIFSSRQESLVGMQLAEAQALVAEVRKERGEIPPTELLYISDEQSEKVAMAVSVMLKKNLNISVSPKNLERGVFYSSLDGMKHSLARSSNTASYLDPMSFLEKFTSDNFLNNLTGFSDKQYDELISKASKETQPALREKLLNEAEKILVSDVAAVVPLYHNPSVNMWKPDVRGISINGLDVHPLSGISFAVLK